MTEFTIALAGRRIRISALFESTRAFCREYLDTESGAPADFSVAITPEDISFERERSDRTAVEEGREPAFFPDNYLETLAVYRKIALQMLNYDTLLFHGSAIAVDGEGYLFTAKSGTGKSTHTRFWREEFGSRAYMVNDDKPLLQITEDGVLVYGSPWCGKHGLHTNTAVPLKAICVLERGEKNEIHPISAREALPLLLQQSYRPQTAQGTMQLLTLLDKAASSTRFYRLHCNLDPSAARVAYEEMQ